MVADERASRFADEFLGAWLYLDAMDRIVVNADYHPIFTDHLKTQMRDETRHFFMELLRGDISATNLIDSTSWSQRNHRAALRHRKHPGFDVSPRPFGCPHPHVVG